MDVLLEVANDEISLEGSRGCSLAKLWQLLDDRMPIKVVGEDLTCLPDPVKQQLWLLLKAPDTPYTFAISNGDTAAEEAAPVPQQVPKGRKGKKRKAEEDDSDAEEDLAAAAAAKGIPVMNGQPVMCFMAPHLAEVHPDELPDHLEEAMQLNIRVLAPVAARLAALRVDDALLSTFKLNHVMFSTLEMLGRQRKNGHVQMDMSKALHAVPRNYFYVLKHLEVRNLVVRHKLLVPSKTREGGWSLTSIVHHTRFMPTSMFGPHCVLQETRGGLQLQAQGEVHAVRDDTVQLRAVSNLIRTSGGEHQRVVESQLKQICHFTGKSGHRQWRRLRNKLVRLGYIEMGHVDLEGKSHACVRLLREYTGGALISTAQEARLAARKAGAGAQVYSEDEEEQESSDDDDAGADTAADADEEEGEDEAEGGKEEDGSASKWDVLTVEASFTRTVLQLLCSAGSKGLMTTELAEKLNMTAKALVKRIHDMMKRYELEITYDVKKKAITNRITAPPGLIASWRAQNPSCLLPAAPTSPLPAPGPLLALPAPTAADLLGDEEEEGDDSSTQGRKRQRLVDGSAAAVEEAPHSTPMQQGVAGNRQQPVVAAAAVGTADQIRIQDGHRGRLSTGAAAAGSLTQEPWAPVTVVAQQRLQVLNQHLVEHGFLLKKEVRRVLRHAGVEPDRPQGVSHRGVDFKTTNRLLALMVERGMAKELVLNTATAIATPGMQSTRNDEVEGVVLPNLDVTDEVAQRISAHSRELARLHHQDNSQKYKDARQQAIAASKNRTLPVALLGPLASGRGARLLGACPAAADAMQLSHRVSLLPRRLRRGQQLGPVTAVLVADADAVLGNGAAAGGSGAEEEDALDESLPRPVAAVPGPGAWAGVVPDRPTAAEEVLHKRRVKRQLDRDEEAARHAMLGYNGYIHSRLVRARLLHKYLCKVAGLAGNPPFTAPQLAPSELQPQQVGQNRTNTGSAGRSSVLPVSVAGSFRLLNIPLQSSSAAGAAAGGARAGAAGNAAAAAGAGGPLYVKAAGDGVVLLVSDIWSYMPVELALQVVGSCQDAGAAFIAAVEASRLVGQLSQEEVRALWDTKYRHRLQTTVNVLARLGLVTSMDSESIFVSSAIRADLPQMPPQQAVPKNYNLAGEGGGQQLQQYWKDLQASFTNELIPLDVRNRCFPGSQTTDIMKSSAWVDVEPQQLPVLGYLKVQAHLSGVPVSSMNAELADQLAVDLGLPYAQVQKVVQYRRTKANLWRVRQGKPKIAIAGERKRRRLSRKGVRKRKRSSRRARRQSQAEGADTEPTGDEGGSSSGSDSDSESGAADEATALRRLDRRASRSSGRARGIPVVVVSVLPPAPSKAAAAADVSGGAPAAAAAAVEEGGGRSRSSSPAPQGQQEADAALRVLQAVDQQVEAGDPERLQDVDALDQYGTLLPGEGGAEQASRRSTPGPGGDDTAADVQTSDEEGGNDVTVPVRVNRRRVKWRHHMDHELLRVVLLQRAEVGFGTKQFWSRLKGLPASCAACHKRYKLLQRKLPEAMQQLEEQTQQVHTMLVERRRTLQQRLFALPAAHVWTRRPHGIEPTNLKRAVLAARHQQVQQEEAQAGSSGGAPSQQPPAGEEAADGAAKAAAGGAAGAGQAPGLPALHEALATVDTLLAAGQLNLAAGGPVLVTPGGNVVLLPSAEEQALLDQVLDNIRQVRYKRVVRYRTRKERPPGEAPPRRQRATPGAEGEGGRTRRKQAAGSWKVARKQRQAMQHLEMVLQGSAAEESDWEEVEQDGTGGTAAAWAAEGTWSAAGSKGSKGKGSTGKMSAFAAHAAAAAWRAAAAVQPGTSAVPAMGPGTAAPGTSAQGAVGSSSSTGAPAVQQQQQQQPAAGLDSTTSIIAGPPLPVAKAVELLVTLLYMSQHKGGPGGLSATALTCRFTSDVIVAAFKWAKALGWVQMATTKKPLALSRTWLRQAHRDPTITRLLMAGAAAEADLNQHLQQAAAASSAPEPPSQQQQQQQQQKGEVGAGHSAPLFQPSGSGLVVGPVGRGPLLLQLMHQAFLGKLRLSLCQERPPEDREGPVLLAAAPQAVRVAAAVPGPEEAAPLVAVRDAGLLPGVLLEDLAHLLVYTHQAGDSPAGLAAANSLGGLAPLAATSSVAHSTATQSSPTAAGWQAVAAAVAEAAGPLVFAAADVARDVGVRQAAEAACWAAVQQGTTGEAAARSAAAAHEVLQQVRAAGGAGTSAAHLLTQQSEQGSSAASIAAVTTCTAAAIRQLRAHGLVRVIAGWRTPLLVASEASQELLAYPPPAASSTAAPGATTADAGTAEPQQPQQQQQQGGEVLVMAGPTGSSRSSQGSGREALLAPWLDPEGRVVPELWQGLVARAVGAVLRSPGIPEPLLMQQLDFISPGSAAALLEALVEQGVLLVKSLALPSPPAFIVRRTVEAVGAGTGLTGAAPPSFLRRRKGAAAGAPGSQPSVVRHYWPSLEHSWSAPARAQPPVQVVYGLSTAASAGPSGAATTSADVEMHDV